MVDPVARQYLEWQENKIKDRNKYWKTLRTAYSDYLKLVDGTEYNEGINGFYYYMQSNYGIQIEIIDGKFGQSYNIQDESKYLLFVMKYA